MQYVDIHDIRCCEGELMVKSNHKCACFVCVHISDEEYFLKTNIII